jgi:hypothetical protein
MSSGRLLFAVVAAYVGIVLGYAAFGDSLDWLASLRARLRHRSRAAVGGLVRAPAGRRYRTGALAVAAVAGLMAFLVVSMRDFGSRGNTDPEAALRRQSADPAPLHPWRAFVPPVAAAQAARNTRQRRPARMQRATEKHVQVVSDLVNVSASVTPPPSTTAPTQVAPSNGPAPLRALAESGAPSPLAAP